MYLNRPKFYILEDKHYIISKSRIFSYETENFLFASQIIFPVVYIKSLKLL